MLAPFDILTRILCIRFTIKLVALPLPYPSHILSFQDLSDLMRKAYWFPHCFFDTWVINLLQPSASNRFSAVPLPSTASNPTLNYVHKH